jgi:hypothetical protein
MALADVLASSAHTILRGALFAAKGGYHVSTLTGAITLNETYPSVCGFDPGGAARNVTLDGDAATDAEFHGLFRVIVNRADAAENLVVLNQAAATIGTINQNEAGIFYHDEDAGWSLVCIVTIALT